MRTRVFVYGTLQRGGRNHRLLRTAVLVGRVRTAPAFRLYDLGAFPALVSGGDQAVAGEVYEVDERTLAELDRLEGHPSFYERRPIPLEDGRSAEAYLLDDARVVGRPVIISATWCTYRKEASS